MPWMAPNLNRTKAWTSYAAGSIHVPNGAPKEADGPPDYASSGRPAASRQGGALSRRESDAVAGLGSLNSTPQASDSLPCLMNRWEIPPIVRKTGTGPQS